MSSTASHNIEDIEPTLGALFIGLVLGAIFLGINWSQTFFYSYTYPEDKNFLKSLVGALWVLDTLSLAFLAHAAYTHTIIGFGNLVFARTMVWSLAGEPLITASTCLTVHLFLVWRIQILDPSWRIFSILIALVSFAAYVITIVITLRGLIAVEKALSIVLVNHEVKWCTIAGDVCFCIVDLTIAGSISYLLYRNRSGFAKTERILNTLTLYIVTTGMIDSTLRLLRIVLTMAYPGSLYMLIPYILTSKAYTNTILATLNSRRRKLHIETDTAIEWKIPARESMEKDPN